VISALNRLGMQAGAPAPAAAAAYDALSAATLQKAPLLPPGALPELTQGFADAAAAAEAAGGGAVAGAYSERVFRALAAQVVAQAGAMSPQQLAAAAAAFAGARHRDDALFACLLGELAARAESAGQGEGAALGGALCAAARMGYRPPDAAAAGQLAAAAARVLAQAPGGQLADLAWALAVMEVMDEELWGLCRQRLAGLPGEWLAVRGGGGGHVLCARPPVLAALTAPRPAD
jgi:hypothetical protein